MKFVSRTHTGKVRRNNEDFLGLAVEQSMAVVADGVGGKSFGEVASKMAVDAALTYMQDVDFNLPPERYKRELANAIKYANDEIITVQRNEPVFADMGTTLVCFGVSNGILHYAWIGDSRVYKISPRRGEIKLLSKDHTLDRSKIDKDLAPDLYQRAGSILTQMVGSILLLKPDTGFSQLDDDDIVLACTDGLSDRVSEAFILEYSQKYTELDQLADKLLDRALDCGGQDNITFVLSQ